MITRAESNVAWCNCGGNLAQEREAFLTRTSNRPADPALDTWVTREQGVHWLRGEWRAARSVSGPCMSLMPDGQRAELPKLPQDGGWAFQ